MPHSDPYTTGSAAFEDEHAPDAFGLQLLGAGYAGRIPEGPDWRHVPAEAGAVVLEHVDPEAWFSRPFVPFGGRPNTARRPIPPVPDVLARARADLAAILYTDEVRATPKAPRRFRRPPRS